MLISLVYFFYYNLFLKRRLVEKLLRTATTQGLVVVRRQACSQRLGPLRVVGAAAGSAGSTPRLRVADDRAGRYVRIHKQTHRNILFGVLCWPDSLRACRTSGLWLLLRASAAPALTAFP